MAAASAPASNAAGAVGAARSTTAELLWLLVPFAVYLLVLATLWFDAPLWDDYDVVLGWLARAHAAASPADLAALLFEQHNEHRLVLLRLALLAGAAFAGGIDFRALMLAGSLAVLGIVLLLRLEFRESLPAPMLGAAAILSLQWSYWEATLMASAVPQLGVLFFSFACIRFAVRGERFGATFAAAFGLLAAASQANGLLALPIAAAAGALGGRHRRALALLALGVLVWLLYLRGYAQPAGHPPPLGAAPWPTLELFLVVVGSVAPRTEAAMATGIGLLAAFGWLLGKGFWRDRPVPAAWAAFVIVSAAAIAAARAELGLGWQSRYAIGSTCLLAIVCSGLLAAVPEARRPRARWAVLAACGAALVISIAAWPEIRKRSIIGHSLREVVARGAPMGVARFVAPSAPDPAGAQRILAAAAANGTYAPERIELHGWNLVAAPPPRTPDRVAGHVDAIEAAGRRLTVSGWSDLPATLPRRTMHVAAPAVFRVVSPVRVLGRHDVAVARRDVDATFSGFQLELEFDSPERAREAAQALCIVVASADGHASRVGGADAACAPPG